MQKVKPTEVEPESKGFFATAFCLPQAFTLIEILVVLAIICVLSGLLFPVVMQAKSNARKTTCISNLKQFHTAFAAYAQDNDGLLPPYQNERNAGFGDGQGHVYKIPERAKELTQALHPYLKNNTVWFCPEDFMATSDVRNIRIDHRYSSYLVNRHLGMGKIIGEKTTMEGPTIWLKSNSQRTSSNTMLMTDCLWPYDPSPDAVARPYSHSGSYNELYFDGHVQTIPWSDKLIK